jgi:hypothetical protein
MLFVLLNNPNSMNDVSAQSNVEWLSLRKAAELKGVTSSAISHFLRLHPVIRDAHYKKMGKVGYVTRDGLALLEFRKSTYRGNQHEKATDERMLLDVQAKTAQDQTALMMAELMKDPIVVMRMEQMKISARLDNVEKKLEIANRLLEDTTPLDLTASQRQFLNERIRALAIHCTVPFGIVWGWIHDQVGKRHVADYVFEDYAVAIKYLKKTYSYYNIPW